MNVLYSQTGLCQTKANSAIDKLIFMNIIVLIKGTGDTPEGHSYH